MLLLIKIYINLIFINDYTVTSILQLYISNKRTSVYQLVDIIDIDL